MLAAPHLVRSNRIGAHILNLAKTASTNDIAFAQASANGRAADGWVVTAEFQTGGRGRLGHRWHSAAGQSLLCSIVLVEDAHNPIPVALLSLAAGVCTCVAIETSSTLIPALRWPNDVFLSGRKIAGVLIERRNVDNACHSVIGIGINCHQQRRDFPTELADSATSLDMELAKNHAIGPAATRHATSMPSVSRPHLLQALINALNDYLAMPKLDAARIHRDWVARTEDIGRRVTLSSGAVSYQGEIVDIDPGASLHLRIGAGIVRRFDAAVTTILTRHGGT